VSRSPVHDTDTAEAPGQQGPAAPKQRRFVYSGQAGGGQSEFMTRGNKPLKRRRKSPFKIVSLLAAVSAVIVFYVWNKIMVNRLDTEVVQLRDKKTVLENNIERYRAEIGRKSDLGRIEEIAKDKLRMVPNPDRQQIIEVEKYQPATRGHEQQ
jgi:cell division protein FtsL